MTRLLLSAVLVLAGGGLISTAQTQQPPSVDLAKKCREMALKAHPPNRVGQKSRAGEAQRQFFGECVSKDGNMPPGPEPQGKKR